MNKKGSEKKGMSACGALVKRNIKNFFKDKGMFFTSLATPLILLVLYATFLHNVYQSSFEGAILQVMGPEYTLDKSLLNGLVGGLLLSSLLAVSTVTVSFCANLFMAQDKATGARNDLTISPVKPQTLALGYYIGTALNALLISCIATCLGMVYLAFTGWYLSALDVLAIFGDVLLLVLFGTALSSLVCYPLTTQGQVSAVGSIVSAGYGFICGAYMPISQFSSGLRTTLSLLPGTYGTSLIRNHTLRGVCDALSEKGMPNEALEVIKTIADCNLTVFDHKVELWVMYLVVIASIAVFAGLYILLNILGEKRDKKQK